MNLFFRFYNSRTQRVNLPPEDFFMDEKDFLLQQRFLVRPTVHTVMDTLLQQEMKVEPRLIKLLCILATQPGQLVKREQLITEIWNDYGGGEAGLNHAISSLRKLLHDNSKALIETIPTRGYILHAEISELKSSADHVLSKSKKGFKQPILYVSVILFSVILIYFLLEMQAANKNSSSISPQKELTIPFDKVNGQSEENSLNTIITYGKDSTEYKLKMIGDGRPEFYVNGKLLTPDEMEKYLDLIHRLQQQSRERERE